jgi:hypothetical protein
MLVLSNYSRDRSRDCCCAGNSFYLDYIHGFPSFQKNVLFSYPLQKGAIHFHFWYEHCTKKKLVIQAWLICIYIYYLNIYSNISRGC